MDRMPSSWYKASKAFRSAFGPELPDALGPYPASALQGGDDRSLLLLRQRYQEAIDTCRILLAGNPVFEGTTLMARETGLKVCGLCHGHYGYQQVARTIGLEPLEDRGLDQEGAHAVRLSLEDLFHQVVQNETVAAGEGFDKSGDILAPLHRKGSQLQSGNPTLSACLQCDDVVR